ncbi:glycosyltransferase family 2 protein [Nocardioides lianchengensis]|uniref:glycosyltransferase family 2 protein n=1 Tax=Nocardioides lianchengensis TaxID=1045774 RepID=UPI00111338DE
MTTHPESSAAAIVVVHHKSLETLGRTIQSLVANDVSADRIVVVDNSGDVVSDEALAHVLVDGVRLLRIPNGGYANAVNRGMLFVGSEMRPGADDGVLVVTHEVLFRLGSVAILADALASDPDLSAVGPVLRAEPRAEGVLWSGGGRLTRFLRLPRHSFEVPAGVNRCAWLDGAAVMYRWKAVRQNPLSEQYFLYMEEVDYHLRLGRAYGPVAVVPEAVASQSSAGQPPYWTCRNIRIFARSWGRPGFRFMAVALTCGKVVARASLHRDGQALRAAVAGYRAGGRRSA